jgi:hypothetical protein
MLKPCWSKGLQRHTSSDLIAKIALQSQLPAQSIASKETYILYRQAKIDKLTHEMAVFKRLTRSAKPSFSNKAGLHSPLTPPGKKGFGAAHQSISAQAVSAWSPRVKVVMAGAAGMGRNDRLCSGI